MAQPQRILAQDSVCKLVQNGDLGKTLNTVRTVPGARNPFVATRQGGSSSSNGSTSSTNSSSTQTTRR
ncbi:MAG: hypothetical protein JWM43_2720 [Acidobacteriaceae bacterium]|nr:hypothetical protein [Acidobacteriaceae bacterium]